MILHYNLNISLKTYKKLGKKIKQGIRLIINKENVFIVIITISF